MKITAYARATLGALALSVLAGCGGTADFSISEEFEIQGTGSQTEERNINLSQLAGDAWDHRDKVKDAKIKSAVAIIRQVHGDNTATSVDGEAVIARSGVSAVVASGTEAVVVGGSHEADDVDGAADILKNALKGDGNLVVSYTADPTPAGATTHITVEVLVDVEVEWSLF